MEMSEDEIAISLTDSMDIIWQTPGDGVRQGSLRAGCPQWVTKSWTQRGDWTTMENVHILFYYY